MQADSVWSYSIRDISKKLISNTNFRNVSILNTVSSNGGQQICSILLSSSLSSTGIFPCLYCRCFEDKQGYYMLFPVKMKPFFHFTKSCFAWQKGHNVATTSNWFILEKEIQEVDKNAPEKVLHIGWNAENRRKNLHINKKVNRSCFKFIAWY